MGITFGQHDTAGNASTESVMQSAVTAQPVYRPPHWQRCSVCPGDLRQGKTTFLLHLAHRRISRYDVRSLIGVAGVGRAMYGNSGISVGELQRGGLDDDQARQPQSVQEMFGADARKMQLNVPRKPSSPSEDVAENGGDLRIGRFVMGYLEQHERQDSRMHI
jgi:hypothetical protein